MCPKRKSPDTPVLRIIQTLLTGGQSSRLYTRMVDTEQLALSVGGGVRTALDPTVFNILHPTALRRGSRRLRRKRCSRNWRACRRRRCPTRSCARPRTRCWPVCYRQLKTIEGRANLLGTYEVFHGDYNKLFTADKEIEAVTAADVQRVARQYFTAKNRTVATLVPEKPEVKQ